MFTAYFDASGSARDPRITTLSVGGFIADDTQLGEFETRWPQTLTEFGIKELSMSAFGQSRGEFKKWADKKHEGTRQDFIQALAKIINECTRQPIGAVVDVVA